MYANSDKDIPADVTPILPDDVNSGKAGPAPPSYEEVMGQYETSINSSQSDIPSLAYIDIMPRILKRGNLKNNVMPTFQPFQEMVNGANSWLANNPNLAVWKCETVERKVLPGQNEAGVLVDLDSMNHFESAWGCNCYVFGIRLWLTQRPADQKGAQEIGLVNITPTPKEIPYTSVHQMGFGGLGVRHYMSTYRVHTLLTYEGLRKCVQDFNAKVKDNPIPGSILNVETATLKFAEGWGIQSAESVAEMSSWHEVSGMTGRRLTQVLRLFYVKGPSTTPQIEIAEFVPTQISQSGLGKSARFADFKDAEHSLAEWLRQQSGIKILNIETREAKYSTFFNQTLELNTDSTDDFDFPMFQTSKLRFLRVFYTSAPSVSSFMHTALTTRLFPPVRLNKGKKRFESMVETMARIDAWLKVTGLPIFGVETVSFLDEGPSSFTKSQYSLRGFVGKNWVTAIRLYFPTAFLEPSPELLPPLPQGNGGSSTCTLF
ncbi:hypothetical protein PoB_006865100 [Plakobranchus ocellatus]|uniref:Uncharacterized protein n=1 Tax=Plakobranchus ocellatus TaxID=259542 RepID=A0AAV4DDC0_9GAST|nr:hypothetical protein PoB_006865100 [Plakobranchus ocellatus]